MPKLIERFLRSGLVKIMAACGAVCLATCIALFVFVSGLSRDETTAFGYFAMITVPVFLWLLVSTVVSVPILVLYIPCKIWDAIQKRDNRR